MRAGDKLLTQLIQLGHDLALVVPTAAESSNFCKWNGHARSYAAVVGDERRKPTAKSYRDPTPVFAMLRDHIDSYAAAMDTCYVDRERIVP